MKNCSSEDWGFVLWLLLTDFHTDNLTNEKVCNFFTGGENEAYEVQMVCHGFSHWENQDHHMEGFLALVQHCVESNTWCGWHQQPEINREVPHSTSSGWILQINGSGPSLCPLLPEDAGPLFLTVFEQGMFSSSFVQNFVKVVTYDHCSFHNFSLLTVFLYLHLLLSFSFC